MGRISLFMVPLLALACGGQPTPLPQYGPDTPPVTLAMVVDDVGVRAATAPTADFAAHVGGALWVEVSKPVGWPTMRSAAATHSFGIRMVAYET